MISTSMEGVSGSNNKGHMTIIRLALDSGVAVDILDYGASLYSFIVPDKEGCFDDIVLGHNHPLDTLENRSFFGASVGRYANRIANAQFSIKGQDYQLEANEGENCLHGGFDGFDKKYWDVIALEDGEAPFVVLQLTSPGGDQGFPGELKVQVKYSLRGPAQLQIDYYGQTDQDTYVNLTNHAFFNLAGAKSDRNILDHKITIFANQYLPVQKNGLPIGQPINVNGAMDLTSPRHIGSLLTTNASDLMAVGGFDHNYCISEKVATTAQKIAIVKDDLSGRCLSVASNQPGLQFYTGNFLNGSILGKYKKQYQKHDGLCLEPQNWPDAPNHKEYPSALLRVGEIYHHMMLFSLSTFNEELQS